VSDLCYRPIHAKAAQYPPPRFSSTKTRPGGSTNESVWQRRTRLGGNPIAQADAAQPSEEVMDRTDRSSQMPRRLLCCLIGAPAARAAWTATSRSAGVSATFAGAPPDGDAPLHVLRPDDTKLTSPVGHQGSDARCHDSRPAARRSTASSRKKIKKLPSRRAAATRSRSRRRPVPGVTRFSTDAPEGVRRKEARHAGRGQLRVRPRPPAGPVQRKGEEGEEERRDADARVTDGPAGPVDLGASGPTQVKKLPSPRRACSLPPSPAAR
jgi:hypothetical protein